MRQTKLKVGITLVAAILMVVRLIWPNLKIDSITIGLFVVAILPWLASLIQSAKLPGGWEITFRDVQEAAKKAAQTTYTPEQMIVRESPSVISSESPSVFEVADLDSNLALVYLRIEIEKRLRMLAKSANLSSTGSLPRLFRDLQKSGVVDDVVFSGLQELIMAGNQAAHGAVVEPSVADSILEFGPKIINALDRSIAGFNQ